VADTPRFVKVSALVDLPPGASLAVWISDHSVAMFNVKGSVCAIETSARMPAVRSRVAPSAARTGPS
jgi:hypothetical protein